jgi:hypothetical protein
MVDIIQMRVDHLQSVQQKGNAGDLPDATEAQPETDRRSEIVDQLGNEHQAELAKLPEMKPNGSLSTVATLRDALGRVMQTTIQKKNTTPPPPPLLRKR